MSDTLKSDAGSESGAGSGFASVLVPTDGSDLAEKAVTPARALARAAGVPMVFLRWEPDPGDAEEGTRSLDALAERYGGDVAVETVLSTADTGGAAEALVAEATARRALICMASHGRTRVGKAVLGSVAADVVSLSVDPVLLVGPDYDADRELVGQRLGVCLDGSPFAEEILPVANEWATRFGLKTWLLESASPTDLAELSQAPAVDVIESSYVARVARRLPGTTNWDVLHARNPVDGIVAYADEQPVGALAMATHARRGWARMAEGSIALQVLHRSPCPVLLVHPADESGGGES
jgi:nucleotide-binding universal stress UspA family protein